MKKSRVLLLIVVLFVFSGYTLPAEPDKKENKKTLLGIDSNNNGVRDDVEIYIFKRYKNERMRDIAFEIAKSLQKILLVTDRKSAFEAKIEFDKASGCIKYYAAKDVKIVKNDADAALFRLKYKIFDAGFRDKQFNTPKRMHTYFSYNRFLSSKVFKNTSEANISKEQCGEILE